MRCGNCEKDYDVNIIIKLKDKMGEQSFCPTCLALMVYNNDLYLENDISLKDDVTGKWGAVEYLSGDEHYVLEKGTMIRLICHNLKKDEYLILTKKYGSDKFQLHDDFYLEDGSAIQPMEIDDFSDNLITDRIEIPFEDGKLIAEISANTDFKEMNIFYEFSNGGVQSLLVVGKDYSKIKGNCPEFIKDKIRILLYENPYSDDYTEKRKINLS